MNIVKVRLDCSKSINLKSNREDLDIVERIDVKEMKVNYFFFIHSFLLT